MKIIEVYNCSSVRIIKNVKTLALKCILLLSSFFASFLNCSAQWKQKEFIIGSYADPRLSYNNDYRKDSTSYAFARNASLNMLSGPQYYIGSKDFSLMDRTLKMAEKFGLKLLVIDSRLKILDSSFNKDTALKIIDHFKYLNSKAFLGYYFGGEFDEKQVEQVKKWVRFFKQNNPGKLAYYYLLPCYGFKTHATYEKYLESYLIDKNKNNLCDVVAYDFYPFSKNHQNIQSYFYNLSIIKQMAGERPFWCYVLTTSTPYYNTPSEYELNFSIFCPLIYGAKGIIYFTYETIPEHYGLKYGEGLINKNSFLTPKYLYIQKINRFLKDVIGPIIMTSENLGVYHTSNQLYNEELEKENQITDKALLISDIQNPFMAAGVFKSNQNKNEYNLLLINKSADTQKGVTVILKGNFTNKISLSVPFTQYSSPKKTFENILATYNQATNKTTCKIDFSPGEERVLKAIAAQ